MFSSIIYVLIYEWYIEYTYILAKRLRSNIYLLKLFLYNSRGHNIYLIKKYWK